MAWLDPGATLDQWLPLAELWLPKHKIMTVLTSWAFVVTIQIHTCQCLVGSKCSRNTKC